ncbi:enoyl-CoA hydratase/isomerase family protein, partial [Micrococcus endophyticus]
MSRTPTTTTAGAAGQDAPADDLLLEVRDASAASPSTGPRALNALTHPMVQQID